MKTKSRANIIREDLKKVGRAIISAKSYLNNYALEDNGELTKETAATVNELDLALNTLRNLIREAV